MSTVIKVENISKQYRLGESGTGTIVHDLNRWWHRLQGKEDPYLQFGEVNDRAIKGVSDYVWALKDINFEVQQGDVLGIIGKNGAGKSTLLKLLSRVSSPTTGSIKAKGRIASLLEVGTGFNNELTGRENIFLNGAILGMTKAEIRRKFDEIVDFSGTERYIDTPVKRYSSGMRVRLAFAVAAHLDPEILIVDEVLAVGDADFQKKAIGKMQDVSKGEGRTVLFVSHNMQAVQQLCKTGIVLRNGRYEFQGTASDAVSLYLKDESIKAESNPIFFPLNEDKPFQVLSARLVDNPGNLCNQFECDDNVIIELECKSNQALPNLYGVITITKDDGAKIIETDSQDYHINKLNNLAKGVYTFKLQVPPRILPVGEFIVYFNFTSPNYDKFHVDSPGYCLKFKVKDSFTKRGAMRKAHTSTILDWVIKNK
jgi:lipopolysaccharide transport system ATP-binding protein